MCQNGSVGFWLIPIDSTYKFSRGYEGFPWGRFFSSKFIFRTYLFQNSLLHNNLFIILVLNFVRIFRHQYGHSNGNNNEFIRLVLHMSWQFRHEYVQSKVGKSMFHFIRQIPYVSTINFLINQSYFHYYLLLWILLWSYRLYLIWIFDSDLLRYEVNQMNSLANPMLRTMPPGTLFIWLCYMDSCPETNILSIVYIYV